MPVSLKLMPDYQASPLWDRETGRNLQLDALPIAAGLKRDLASWAEKFDDTLNVGDPVNSGFRSQEALRAFEEEGIRLWRRIRAELGEAADVRYFSSITRRLLDPGAI